jgi:DNA-binding winged helix-turn-helix (wHTH) protein/TolB-like protein/Tfp pilus assembly protein PilF
LGQSSPFAPTAFEFGDFTLDVVERQLYRGDQRIALTLKVLDTLELLVEAGGKVVDRETFQQRLWPDTVVEERNLTVNVSTLRRVLNGSGDVDYIETVPKIGYRLTVPVRVKEAPLLDAAVEPAAVIQASVTIVPAVPPPGGDFVSRRAWHWSVRAAFLAGVVVVLGGLGALSIGDGVPVVPGAWAAPRTTVRIAVLPFVVAGGSPQDDGLGLALADGVIARLDGLSPVSVLPASTVMAFTGGGDPVSIGKTLGVDHIVEGVFQRVGSAAIVTSRVIDIATGAAIWNERFEHPYSDFFDLQDALSTGVADSFMLRMSVERSYTTDPKRPSSAEAYRAYLEGRMATRRLSQRGMLDASIAALRRSIALDAEFAPAWTALARSYRVKAHERPLRERMEIGQQARAAVDRALMLDPQLPEAHIVLGLLKYNFEWNWDGAERDFRRAVELDSRIEDAHSWLANFLRAQGRYEESIQQFEEARRINPFGGTYAQLLGEAYWFAGRLDEALGMLDQASRLNPANSTPHWRRVWIYDTLGRRDEALAGRRVAVRLENDPDFAPAFEREYAKGYQAALEAELRWRGLREDLWEMAHLELLLGRTDVALDLIERCVNEYCANAPILATEPRFRTLHAEPRFRALAARAHLSQLLSPAGALSLATAHIPARH